MYGPVALMMPYRSVRQRAVEHAMTDLGADAEFASGELVLDLSTDQLAVGIFVELGDTTVVDDGRTKFDGGHD